MGFFFSLNFYIKNFLDFLYPPGRDDVQKKKQKHCEYFMYEKLIET